MDTIRECGCKGRRSCLWCEEHYNLLPDFQLPIETRRHGYVFCPKCNCAWEGWDADVINQHPQHQGKSVNLNGVLVVEDFLSRDEVDSLITGIDQEPWDISQSGRRKQNYGPKCNFKKRKLAKGNFTGFPKFTNFVQRKFNDVPILKDFYTIEQCSLEYDPTKGACIDPHIDDCWIWGERIVTVNVVGDSVLTMLPYSGGISKYNLDIVPNLPSLLVNDDVIIRIFMPARSLIVLSNEARYCWEHCVLREDTPIRRVCLAYREFTDPYLPGGDKEAEGKEILAISKESCLSD